MCMGKSLVEYAGKGDLYNFRRLFLECPDYDMMYWHVQRAFKAAVKERQLNVIEYIIDELQMSLKHEAFDKFLHIFIFNC